MAPSRARLRSNDLSYTDDLAEFNDLSAQNQFLDEQVEEPDYQV